MSKKITYKINCVLLGVLILNLTAGNLLFMPKQAKACVNPSTGEIVTDHCWSCDKTSKKCYSDPEGPYWCGIKCNNECKDSETSSSESPSGPIDVIIVGPTPSCTPVNPNDFFSTISTLYQGTEIAENAINTLVKAIQNDEKIPEDLKPWLINTIQNADNIEDSIKTELIDIINKNEKIPEDLKSLVISVIQGNKDIGGLIKNWLLGLLLKHVNVEHICKSLSDIAANITVFGTTVGTPLAMFITQMCPIILNEILQAFLKTLPKPSAPEYTQVIEYPTFESYQWEVGIPGFFKPGEITPFK